MGLYDKCYMEHRYLFICELLMKNENIIIISHLDLYINKDYSIL